MLWRAGRGMVHSSEQPCWRFSLVLCTTTEHLPSTHRHRCTSQTVSQDELGHYSLHVHCPLPAPSRSLCYDKHPKICDGARAWAQCALCTANDGCRLPAPVWLLSPRGSAHPAPEWHPQHLDLPLPIPECGTGRAIPPARSSAGCESPAGPRSQPASLARCWLPPSLYRMYNSYSPSICCCHHLRILPFSSLGEIKQEFGAGE